MLNQKFLEQLTTLVALGLLIFGCTLVLLPFISSLIWAAILVFSTRHVYWHLNNRLGNKPWISAGVLVGLILLFIIVPLTYAIISFTQGATEFASTVRGWLENGPPPLPEWITNIRWVGPKLQEYWQKIIVGDPDIRRLLSEHGVGALKGVVKVGAYAGQGILYLLLSVVLAYFLYVALPTVTIWLQAVVKRVSGTRAEQLLNITGSTIQGVVFGILGTAVAQGFLVGIALFIAHIPSAAGLTFLAILLSLLPMGAAIIWIPAAIWLFQHDQTGMAIFMVLWCAGIAGSADNVIKPLLIGKNSNLPFILIVLGVLGGAVAFGALGVFLGPTLLAIGYALTKDWIVGMNNRIVLPQEQAAAAPETDPSKIHLP